MNIILDKFRKVNTDWLCNKAIKTLTWDNYVGVFYDKRFDSFFTGDFNEIIKNKGSESVLTLATYCIVDFFGDGFAYLKYWQKMKEIDKTYLALRSTMIDDCFTFLKKYEEATYEPEPAPAAA